MLYSFVVATDFLTNTNVLREREVSHSALFTYLVGWHAGAVSFSRSDIILAQLVYPLSDVMFCLHSGREYLKGEVSLYR